MFYISEYVTAHIHSSYAPRREKRHTRLLACSIVVLLLCHFDEWKRYRFPFNGVVVDVVVGNVEGVRRSLASQVVGWWGSGTLHIEFRHTDTRGLHRNVCSCGGVLGV